MKKAVAEISVEQAKLALKTAVKAGNTDVAESKIKSAMKTQPSVPSRTRYITNDPTIEKLGELLNENPKGLLIERDELSGFLRNLDREDRSNDRAFYLECWNGTGRYTYDRIGRGTIDIEAATISIIGGIQPSKLERYVLGAVTGGIDDDGLLQRFQLAVYPDISKAWKYVDQWPEKEAKNRVFEILKTLAEWNAQNQSADINESDSNSEPEKSPERICGIRFSEHAQELFTTWFEELMTDLRSDEIHPAMESHLSKFPSLIPSLALIIQIANDVNAYLDRKQGEQPDGESKEDGSVSFVSTEVTRFSLEKALAWGEYLQSHAERIYALAIDPSITNAKTILAKIKAGELENPFMARDVHRKCWTGLVETDAVRDALTLLCEHHYLRAQRTKNSTGRPSTKYSVNPKAFSKSR